MLCAALALTFVAQDPTPFDGAAFAFALPPGMHVNENGNGSYFFTEVRRDARSEDQADPTIKFLVIPGGGGFDAAGLVDGLVADITPRMAQAGLERLSSEPLTLSVDGHESVGKRLVWGQSAAPAWSFDVTVWSSGATLVGLVTKCASATLDEERAQIDALLAAIDAKPFDAETPRFVTAGFATVPVPAIADVQVQTGSAETMTVINTREGRLFLHWGDAGPRYVGTDDLAKDWQEQHDTEVRAMAAQAGAQFKSSEGFVQSAGGRVVQGRAQRLKLADGQVHEFRSTTHTSMTQVLVVTAELAGESANVQRARIDAIVDAIPFDDETASRDIVAAGVQFSTAPLLGGAWSVSEGRPRIELVPRSRAAAPHTTFVLERTNAGEQAPTPAEAVDALRVRWYAESTIVHTSNTTTAWLGAERATAELVLEQGGDSFVVRATVVQRGEQALVAGSRSRIEDDHVHARVWRQWLAEAQLIATEGGNAPLATARYTAVLPSIEWVAQTTRDHDLMSLTALAGGASFEALLGEYTNNFEFAKCVESSAEAFQICTGQQRSELASGFGATRRFGEALAAGDCGVATIEGEERFVRTYASTDELGDVELTAIAAPGADPDVSSELDALIASFRVELPMNELTAAVDSLGLGFDAPQGLAIDETLDNGYSFVTIVPVGGGGAVLSMRIFVDREADAAAREASYQLNELGYLCSDRGVEFEPTERILSIGGTDVSAAHTLLAAVDEMDALDATFGAFAHEPFVVGFRITGRPAVLRESEAILVETLASLHTTELRQHFGAGEASFTHAANLAPTVVNRDGTTDVTLRAPSGAELRLRHAQGAWTNEPTRAALTDQALIDVLDSLAARSAAVQRAFSNAWIRAAFPTGGELTEEGNGVRWVEPASGSSVRVEVLTDRKGEIDLYDSLRNLTNGSFVPDPTSISRWRLQRELFGRATLGSVQCAHFDGQPDVERQLFVVRFRGTDLVVRADLRPSEPRSRAQVEAILSSLRLAHQPTARGRVIQLDLASFVVPWHALTRIEAWGRAAGRVNIDFADGAASFALWMGPDDDVEREDQEGDAADIFGASFPPGAPTTQRFGSHEVEGREWIVTDGLRHFRFSFAGRQVQWMSSFHDLDALTAWGPVEQAILASLEYQ